MIYNSKPHYTIDYTVQFTGLAQIAVLMIHSILSRFEYSYEVALGSGPIY